MSNHIRVAIFLLLAICSDASAQHVRGRTCTNNCCRACHYPIASTGLSEVTIREVVARDSWTSLTTSRSSDGQATFKLGIGSSDPTIVDRITVSITVKGGKTKVNVLDAKGGVLVEEVATTPCDVDVVATVDFSPSSQLPQSIYKFKKVVDETGLAGMFEIKAESANFFVDMPVAVYDGDYVSLECGYDSPVPVQFNRQLGLRVTGGKREQSDRSFLVMLKDDASEIVFRMYGRVGGRDLVPFKVTGRTAIMELGLVRAVYAPDCAVCFRRVDRSTSVAVKDVAK